MNAPSIWNGSRKKGDEPTENGKELKNLSLFNEKMLSKQEFRDAVLRRKGIRQREKQILTLKARKKEREIIAYLGCQKGERKEELGKFSQGKKGGEGKI